MKVLHITTYLSGGAGKATVRLHKGLLSLGVESNILALVSDKENSKIINVFLYRELVKNNLIVSLYNRILESYRWRRNSFLLKNRKTDFFSIHGIYYNLSQLYLLKQTDLIHFHWVANFINYGNILNKPVFWTLHDMNPFTGGCHYSANCIKYKMFCDKNCPQLNSVAVEKTFKIKNQFVENNKISFISPSLWLYKEALNSTICKDSEVYHIPNGVDVDIYIEYDKNEARDYFLLPKDKKIVLFIAENPELKRKGYEFFLKLYELFKERNDILFCIVGKSNIKGKNIINLGYLNEDKKLAMAYSASDVFLILSLEDNFPNTVIEAMACGRPVIAFKTGGIVDVVKDNETGFTVDLGDVDGLYDRLLNLLFDENLYRRISYNCKKEITTNYTHIVQAKKYIKIYEKNIK